MRVDGVEAAIACANDNAYGLSAAVYGRDTARAFEVARRIRSGICHVNGPTVHDEAQMPFGGVKGSGWGRFGGKAGIAEFTELPGSRCRPGPGTTRSDPGEMAFSEQERALLLSTPRLGPGVVHRLEEVGLDSLQRLRQVGVDAAIDLVCLRMSGRAWANRRKPLRQLLDALAA